MPVKLSWESFSGTAMTKAGRLSGARGQRIAAEFNRLDAAYKRALQGLGNEGILSARKFPCDAVVPLPSRPTAVR